MILFLKTFEGDEKMFEGTPLQIVRGWRDSSPLTRRLPIPEYVKTVVDAWYFGDGVHLRVVGEDDEALATSLIEELIRHNLATRH